MDRIAIEQTKTFSIDQEAIETNYRKLQWIENAIRSVKKSNPRVSIDSYLSKAVEMDKNNFLKKRKT